MRKTKEFLSMKICRNALCLVLLLSGTVLAASPDLPQLHEYARPGQWVSVEARGGLIRRVVLDVEYHQGKLLYIVQETQLRDENGEFAMTGKAIGWGDQYAWERERLLRNCVHREEATLVIGGKQVRCVAAIMRNGSRYYLSADVMGGDLVKAEPAEPGDAAGFTLLDYGDGIDVSSVFESDDGRAALTDPAMAKPEVGQWVEHAVYADDAETGEKVVMKTIRQEIVAVEGEHDAMVVTIRETTHDSEGTLLEETERKYDSDAIALSEKLFKAAMRHGGGKVVRSEYEMNGKTIPVVEVLGNSFFRENRIVSPAVPVSGIVMTYAYTGDKDKPHTRVTGFGGPTGR